MVYYDLRLTCQSNSTRLKAKRRLQLVGSLIVVLSAAQGLIEGIRLDMAITTIVANLVAPDPAALASFYHEVFALDLTHDMGWITFLSRDAAQKIELHTASEGGRGTELPAISIGVDDLEATEAAIRAAGGKVFTGL